MIIQTGIVSLDNLFTMSYFGNTMSDYLVAFIALVVILISIKIFKSVVIRALIKASKKTKNTIDDYLIGIIKGVGWPSYILLGLYFVIKLLVVPDIVNTLLYFALVIVTAFYAIRVVQNIIDVSTSHIVERRRKEGGEVDVTIISLVKKILKLIMWVAVFLFLASSAGFDVSSAFVGVGVTGIVLGFALQNVLADVFAAFSIYFDKPFEKGDFIVIGDDSGTVDKIGIRSTRIKHLKGHELVVSNRELTSIRINNYKKMKKRRVAFNIGVTYQTPPKKLKKIPKIVTNIITDVKMASLDRVHFKEFGDSALIYEIVYYAETKDYKEYMDMQQEINMNLVESFSKEKIEFAYPTQTIFLEK